MLYGPPNIIRTCEPLPCCDSQWETAYLRFETPEQEVAKFKKRLRRLGVDQLLESSRVADLFCGRGGGIVALRQLGFDDVVGVDLSEELLLQNPGPETLYVADCRRLPFPDGSKDLLVIQGGLHHLPDLSNDLPEVFSEARRVLDPTGRIVIVEPWNTAFLRVVHAFSRNPVARRSWDRLDAFEIMYEREKDTYDRWLGSGALILDALESIFVAERLEMSWGKLRYLGSPRAAGSGSKGVGSQ